MTYTHTPVLLTEAIDYLNPLKGGRFVDATLGGGGYTEKIARLVGSDGLVLSIDADLIAIDNFVLKSKQFPQVFLAHDYFGNLDEVIKKSFDPKIKFNGMVFDLGLSSAQLEDTSRGFSFKLDSRLDMAFGQSADVSTEQIVNDWPEEKLIAIFRDYGEEKYARKIAGGIVAARKKKPINYTFQLIEIIKHNIPYAYQNNKRIHFATRSFQALRIATNDELEQLKRVLPQALSWLAPKGRIVVISYHSLEDRIVKRFFRQEATGCLCPKQLPVCQCGHEPVLKILTKKVVIPTEQEIESNPRSRSAKLRAAEKI